MRPQHTRSMPIVIYHVIYRGTQMDVLNIIVQPKAICQCSEEEGCCARYFTVIVSVSQPLYMTIAYLSGSNTVTIWSPRKQ